MMQTIQSTTDINISSQKHKDVHLQREICFILTDSWEVVVELTDLVLVMPVVYWLTANEA